MINKALLWKEYHGNKLIYLLAGLYFYQPLRLLLPAAGRISLRGVNQTMIVMAGVMGLALGLTMLGQERRRGTMDFLLSLPFPRQQIFINKLLYSLAGMAAVHLINYGALWLARGQHPMMISAEFINNLLGQQLVVSLFVFAFTLIFSTIAGSMLATGVFTGIFSIFPSAVAALIYINLAGFLGSGPVDPGLLQKFHFIEDLLFKWPSRITPIEFLAVGDHLPWIVLASVILLWGAYMLFLRNPIEKNGEILVFSKLNIILKVGVSVCFALLFGALVAHLGLVWQIIAIALGGVLGWLLIAYLIKQARNQA